VQEVYPTPSIFSHFHWNNFVFNGNEAIISIFFTSVYLFLVFKSSQARFIAICKRYAYVGFLAIGISEQKNEILSSRISIIAYRRTFTASFKDTATT
jgi:hypothetical protein